MHIANLESKLTATGISALSSRSWGQTKNEITKKKARLEDIFISKGYEGLGISKNDDNSAAHGGESKDPSTPLVIVEDTRKPESNDQAKLVRQIRIS